MGGASRGKGNRSTMLLVARPEYVAAMDKLLLGEGFVSRAHLVEAAIAEYAAKRGTTMPMRLAGAHNRYTHADE